MSQKIKTSVDVDGYLSADHLKVSTSSIENVDVGEIVWNAIDGTFDMGLIGGVTLQAGQELHIYGKATEVVSNGQAVMFAGVQGDHILISKADSATINSNPEYLIGVATQDFATNDFGYVTVFGNVRGLDTTAYTLGSVLYYDSTTVTDGLLTATMPTAPNAKIEVAAVVRVHSTQGILLVRPHVMPKLKDVQDVYAPTPSNEDGLWWNTANSRYENNSIYGILGYTPADDDQVVKLTGDQTIEGLKTFSSTVSAPIFELDANNAIGSNYNYIGQTMANNDSWKIYGNTIATDRGEMVFELGDNASSSSSNGQRFNFYYNNISSGTTKSPFILDYNDAIFDTNASFTGNISLSNGSYYKVGSINLVNDTKYIPKATTLGYFINSLLYDNGTNVGIGTDLPNEKLEVNGYILSNDGSYGGKVSLGSSSGPYISGNALTGQLGLSSSAGSPSMIIDIAGRVGIGTINPSKKLVVDGGSSDYLPIWAKSSLLASSKYYSSLLVGYALTSNQSTQFGYVYDTVTPTNSYAHITPFGSLEGSKFMVRADGNVGIGTTSPITKLDVNGSIKYSNRAYYSTTATVGSSSTVKWILQNSSGINVTTTSTNKVYRLQLTTTSTSVNTGEVWIAQNIDGAGWSVKRVYTTQDFVGSTYAYMFVDSDGLPKVTLSHPSSYNILISVEEYDGGYNGTTYGIFGLDSQISSVGTNVGIGTSGSPVSKLQINSGWGNVPITSNRMLQMDLGDVSDYQQHVILLHPIYDTTLINYNFCIGSIYSARGTSSAGRISDNYNVDTASAYNSTSGTVNSTGQFGKLYTCMYNGVKYIALMPFYRTSATGYTFDGYSSSTGEQLKIVVYRTSNTGVVNNSEVYNSLVEYASGPSLYQGDIQTAKSLYASGNIAIGTGTSTTKLTIDNSASSNTNHIDMVGYSSTAKGHIGTFTNALYLSSNYYYAGGQNADTTSLGQAAIILQAAATTGSYIDFNTGSAGATFPTNRMRITSDGNVGIGVVPETWSSPVKALQIGTRASLYDTAGSTILGYNTYFNTTNKYIYSTSYAMRYFMNDSGHAWETAPGGTADANITYTERMRITPGGNVDINIPTVNASEPLRVKGAGAVSKYGIFVQLNSSAAIGYPMRFWNEASNSAVGSITMNSASTSYNTSSDYRLKEDIKPIENALERLQNLKPVNFAWKVDGSRVDGFIAHELADVIPSAVSGEKDATEEVEVTPAVLDEEGNLVEEAVFETRDVYQGIDQSKIVPLLVAAIQEQQEIIKQLENRIINLENK